LTGKHLADRRVVTAHSYEIVLAGTLGRAGREAFEALEQWSERDCTVLIGELDQSALFGVLYRIHALSLELVGLRRIEPPAADHDTSRSGGRVLGIPGNRRA
jgi:hypothetical protein